MVTFLAMPFPMSWRPHSHIIAYIIRRTPAALWWHCGGAGKFGHRWKASQVLTTPLTFLGHHQCLIRKWGIATRSPNHRAVAANIGGWHCSSRMYLGPGAPRGLQWRFVDFPITGWWSWDGWTMGRREVALQCTFYKVAPAVLSPCHHPMSVAVAMLSQCGISASGASGSPEYKGLEFLRYP